MTWKFCGGVSYLFLFRVFQHVGCPHGCGDSRRDPSSDFIRSQGLLLLGQLHRISGKYFRSFLRQMLTCRYTLVEVIDFLHALVGFCVDPGFVLSPISMSTIDHLICSFPFFILIKIPLFVFYLFFCWFDRSEKKFTTGSGRWTNRNELRTQFQFATHN